MKLKRIQAGLYTTEDGAWRIEKDGYEQMRSDEAVARIGQGDERYTGGSAVSEGSSIYHSGSGSTLYYEPEEPVWLIFKGDSDDHQGEMWDTLREARARLETLIKLDAAS